MSLPDGVRGIIPLSDIVSRRSLRTGSLAAGATETFLVTTALGEVWDTIFIGFWVGGQAAATGNHRLEIFGIWTDPDGDRILLRVADITVSGTVAFPFANCPMVPPANIVSRLPDTDVALITNITSHVIGREVGINDVLTMRYTNGLGVTQVSPRRYLVLGRRSMDVQI